MTERAGLFLWVYLDNLNSSIKVLGANDPTPYLDLLIGNSTLKSSVQAIFLEGYNSFFYLWNIAWRPSEEIETVYPFLDFNKLVDDVIVI